MEYDLEIERIVEEINKSNAKRILVQLPEGLRRLALNIQYSLKEKTNVEIFFWAGSCFGACDIPLVVKSFNIDLLIHFGHARWKI